MKKILFTVVIFIICLVIFETISRFIETDTNTHSLQQAPTGWQSRYFRSFLGWHENDPQLLWRFKAELDNPLIKTNRDHLLGQEISQSKDSATYRILLLGDSSPVGLGLKSRRDAFGELLIYLLELQYPGYRKIELVNSAVSGYSSEQILKFLEIKGWDYEPDLVILYCGNNDASISGSVTDRELIQEQSFKSIRTIFSNSAFYRILTRLLKSSDSKTGEYNRLTVRVTPEQYGENIDCIVNQCRANRCPLIICKPEVPLLWPAGLQFRILRHIKDKNDQLIFPEELKNILGREIKYCLDSARFTSLYRKPDIFTKQVYESAYDDTMSVGDAITFYQTQLRDDSTDYITNNNLGVSYWQNSEFKKADYYLKKAREIYIEQNSNLSYAATAGGSPFLFNIGINLTDIENPEKEKTDINPAALTYLDSALQADYFSLRIKSEYIEVLDKFKNLENVSIIELPAVFSDNSGEFLFIDHCHPTRYGHLLIAETILGEIKRKGYFFK
jgi:lysophospholipase L1-like esterase